VRKAAIDAIRTYVRDEFNGEVSVVDRAALDPETSLAVEEELLRETGAAINFDLKANSAGAPVSPGEIADALKWILRNWTYSLDDAEQRAVTAELSAYMEEESLIYIQDSRARSKLVDSLVGSFRSKATSPESLREHLRAAVPTEYLKINPGALDSTAEHLHALFSNAHGRSFTERTAGLLIDELEPRIQAGGEARRIIRDDLYALLERTAAVPSSLLGSSRGVRETLFLEAELGGMIVILERLDTYLLKSQVQSVAIALVTVFILLWVQFKSVKMGIVTLSPILLVTLFNFAILGFFGVPLDYATMLVGSILIGVGIDYSIHFTARYSLERKSGSGPVGAIEKTLVTTGTAIVVNAAMVAFGFFVLIAGNLIPIRRAGYITGALMLFSASVALVYLPAAFVLLEKFFTDR
jgi:hypothetical protein